MTEPDPWHDYIEAVIRDICRLPDRDNANKYVLSVSLDELRAIMARQAWQFGKFNDDHAETRSEADVITDLLRAVEAKD